MEPKRNRNDAYSPLPLSITTGFTHPTSASPGPTTLKLLHTHRDSHQVADGFPGTCSNTSKQNTMKSHAKQISPREESTQHFTPSSHPINSLCKASTPPLSLPKGNGREKSDAGVRNHSPSPNKDKHQPQGLNQHCNGDVHVTPASDILVKKHKKKKRKASESSERTESVISHLDPPERSNDSQGAHVKPKKCNPLQSPSPTKHISKPTNQNPDSEETENKRKKKKKVKTNQCEEEDPPKNGSGVASPEGPDVNQIIRKTKKKKQKLQGQERQNSTDSECVTEPKPTAREEAVVCAWDSHIKDGYKRPSSIPCAEKKFRPTWDGTKNSSVVQELLKNSDNKAYGTDVLTWDGEESAVSRDAAKDAREARDDTVIDEWDEDFDRGKVRKLKMKRDKWRSKNSFQSLQNRRNFWSVTQQSQFSRLGYRS